MLGGQLAAVDLALIAIGIALVVAGSLSDAWASRGEAGGGTTVRAGGVLLIGPFPVVLATDPSTARALMVLALALLVAAWLVLRRG